MAAGFYADIVRVNSGDHDDAGFGAHALDALEHLQAGEARQEHIEQNHIGLALLDMGQRLFARSSWTDRGPVMVQTLMIESFENSQRIIAVSRESVGLRADFILKTELREFQAEYYSGPKPIVRVRINAKMVQMPRRAIIGSQSFEAVAEAEADTMTEIVAAFHEALGKSLKHMVEWTLKIGQWALGE